jgi:hypothetical protein
MMTIIMVFEKGRVLMIVKKDIAMGVDEQTIAKHYFNLFVLSMHKPSGDIDSKNNIAVYQIIPFAM